MKKKKTINIIFHPEHYFSFLKMLSIAINSPVSWVQFKKINAHTPKLRTIFVSCGDRTRDTYRRKPIA